MVHHSPTILDVRIITTSEWGKPINTSVGRASTLRAAFERVTQVLQQWSKAEGAIKVGTQVSIVDLRDGGKLFTMQYLGFEPLLTDGGNQ